MSVLIQSLGLAFVLDLEEDADLQRSYCLLGRGRQLRYFFHYFTLKRCFTHTNQLASPKILTL